MHAQEELIGKFVGKKLIQLLKLKINAGAHLVTPVTFSITLFI